MTQTNLQFAMKTQTTTVFLCALLLSTFGHEYLKAHHQAVQAKLGNHHHDRSHSHVLSQFQFRNQEQECSWQCPTDGNQTHSGGLQLHVSIDGNIIGIVNVTASAAVVVDIKANLIVALNGTTGSAVVLNIKTETGYFISSGIWLSSQLSFDKYFEALVSLQVVWNVGVKTGQSFTVSTCPLVILQHVAGILVWLGAGLTKQLSVTVNLALKLLLSIGLGLTELIGGVLKVVFVGLGKVVLQLRGDILWLLEVLKGLVDFFAKVKGGIQILEEKSIKLRLDLILGAASGLGALLVIVQDLAPHFDLGDLLAGILVNVQVLLKVVLQLGGNLLVGENGVLNLVSKILGVLSGNVSLELLLRALVDFTLSLGVDLSALLATVQALLDVLLGQDAKYHNAGVLKVVIDLLKGLLSPAWNVQGINLSAVLILLSHVGSIQPLNLILRILLALRVGIAVERALPQLILDLIVRLNTTVGAEVVAHIIPNLNLAYTSSGQIDVIGTIKKQLNLVALIPVLLNIPVLLSRLPIIGPIYTAISVALKEESNGSLNLSVIINSKEAVSIVAQIKSWLSAQLNISFNIGIGIGGSQGGSSGGFGGSTGSSSGGGSGGSSGSGSGGSTGSTSGGGSSGGSGSGTGGSTGGSSGGGSSGGSGSGSGGIIGGGAGGIFGGGSGSSTGGSSGGGSSGGSGSGSGGIIGDGAGGISGGGSGGSTGTGSGGSTGGSAGGSSAGGSGGGVIGGILGGGGGGSGSWSFGGHNRNKPPQVHNVAGHHTLQHEEKHHGHYVKSS